VAKVSVLLCSAESLKQIRPDTGICHLRVPQAGSLVDFLLNSDLAPLDIVPTRSLVGEWLHYGSVYVEGRRMREDCALQAGQIIRLHTRRKTYVTETPMLIERIAADHADFLVLDKPSGLPTHATLDNYIENAAYLLSQELGIALYVTHRLDVATEGLLILAKSPKAQAAINKQFAKRQVEKIYRAVTLKPVEARLHTHYMDPQSRVPKVISATPVAGWWECRLEVQSCTEFEDDWHIQLQLLTGKTHQIRAQLAYLGAPIKGDHVYGSKSVDTHRQIALECFELKFRWLQRAFYIRRKSHDRIWQIVMNDV